MHFHKVHGRAIKVCEGGTVAKRTAEFCNGIAFSAQPMKSGQKVCVELSQGSEWSGALRLGVSTQDPGKLATADLPRYACPDLTNKPGYWARGLKESYAQTGNRITFYVNAAGQMHYFINNEHKGIFLNHLPVSQSLWILFDIYGNTTAAKFVPPDEAPVEIVARGPDALRGYHQACESGMQAVFRTRLMLVGQDRVGKTSLKKSLLGLRHNESEESTDGIDLSASCSFNLRDRQSWKLALSREPVPLQADPGDEMSRTGGVECLEEEYHRALATNIVQELLHRKRVKEKEEHDHRHHQKEPRSATHPSAGRRRDRSNSTLKQELQDDLSSQELMQEIPQRVAELVEEMWKARQKGARQNSATTSEQDQSGRNITLNIWDFAGQAAYYTTHQVFLSTRAVYVIVFDLRKDLLRPAHGEGGPDQVYKENLDMSCLDYMDYWMNSIHAHTAQNTRNSVDNTTLSPPIFIVGTHRSSLDEMDGKPDQQLVEEKFGQIRKLINGRPYQRHIVPEFYAVENKIQDGEDSEVVRLRRHIEEVASKEPYMGEQMPLRWLKFEQAVAGMVEEGTYFASLEQVREVAHEAGISLDSEFSTMLAFYHDLGVLVHYGTSPALHSILQNTVILRPQWLVDMFRRFINAKNIDSQPISLLESWQKLHKYGILEEPIIDQVWHDIVGQKMALLGLMEKFDLICTRLPPKNLSPREAQKYGQSYYVPSRLRKCSDSGCLCTPTHKDVIFYLDFHGFLSDGLFHRLLTRAIRWSQDCGGHEPELHYRKGRFFMDPEHDFVLEMAPLKYARVKVTVLRVLFLDDSDESFGEETDSQLVLPPKPNACARVRNFLESALNDLRELWMKRLSYRASVECICDRPCVSHNQARCSDPDCLHLLNLDECISSKVVCCEHRRVKTGLYRKWFPTPRPVAKRGPVLPGMIQQETLDNCSNIETLKDIDFPSWVKSVAKLLNGGSDGQDWMALAGHLGYQKNKVEKFGEDLNPGLAVITDWIISSGNTALSVDMMMSILEQMQRDDIVEIIQKGRESEVDLPPVFISYQWDAQDEVQAMRDRLEKAGFRCWMDIGQMGGGDQLYGKIDEGIRGAKVIISCVTPKYVVSHHCNRELSLGDLLRKPIIPVVFDKVPWPPPGGMALMFCQLVYVDMKGVGGHGGSGIHADLEDRYQEIIQRVSQYAVPDPKESVPLSPREPQVPSDSYQSSTVVQPYDDHSDQAQLYMGSSQQLMLPGYQQEYPNGPNIEGAQSVESSPREGSSGRGVGVQQVHVTKCTVCVIL